MCADVTYYRVLWVFYHVENKIFPPTFCRTFSFITAPASNFHRAMNSEIFHKILYTVDKHLLDNYKLRYLTNLNSNNCGLGA
jgi:hypothetical protein